VREEHLTEVDEPDGRLEQLALRPLSTVEEQPLAAASDQQRRWGPTGCRRAARCPEKDDVEVHDPRS
jgi:hypothetical protein